ncbi:MAG: TIGR02444 family protein [Sphingomonadales bacterium]|nr:TIGR02444 family protein [Sphingomonadales bacterium]NCP00210.1 TIGR02444 family protein [Sphingomonadales bacterium]NCP49927.1 TIGR02444 family protein [Sphingomonadales bacterium]NCQ10018.1 TIGR02444 family protein [Sphingomonadales bacterium]NCQ49804.1 TIGR02444 family protein [Sphingomonadales bacterium]
MTAKRLSRRASSLWRFSLAVYLQPQVPPACLALQDRHEVDVNLLLYAGWRAWGGDALSREGCRTALERSEVWRRELVLPLRTIRRQAGTLARNDPTFAHVYASLKACELQLERQQQAMLADGSDQDSGTSADIITALEIFAATFDILGEPEVRPALTTIAAAMEAVVR